jgi:hypothetical protein
MLEPSMAETIMPCFNIAKREGDLIGRILAGYGELELEMAQCAMAANGNDVDKVVKRLFKDRGELKRIRMADSMMKAQYGRVGLRVPYDRAIKDMNFCRTIRNQYAHCNWYHTTAEGLCFIDLEHLARLSKRIVQVTARRRPLNVALLEQQEVYFKYVQRCFWYLAEAYKVKVGLLHQAPLWMRPKRIRRPRRHS